MKEGPSIATIAALMGDPARANMLGALMAGRALTAGELAREAGVSAPTASGHLARLSEAGLVLVEAQGRHRYFRLSGPDVAHVLEGLMGLAARTGRLRPRPGPRQRRHIPTAIPHAPRHAHRELKERKELLRQQVQRLVDLIDIRHLQLNLIDHRQPVAVLTVVRIERGDLVQCLIDISINQRRNLPLRKPLALRPVPAVGKGPRHQRCRRLGELLQPRHRADEPPQHELMLTHFAAVVLLNRFAHLKLRGRKEPRVVDQVGEKSLERARHSGPSLPPTRPSPGFYLASLATNRQTSRSDIVRPVRSPNTCTR